MSTQPSVIVTQPNFQQVWDALFGNKQTASPVPAMYLAAKNTLAALSGTVAAAVAAAVANWQAVLAANPDYLISPATVFDWSPLNAAVEALNALTPVQSAVNSYAAALSTWYAQNQGSLNPASVPAVPAILSPYQEVSNG